jgi:hypothetical protein
MRDGRKFMVETTIDYNAIDCDIVPVAIRNKGQKASRAGGAIIVKVQEQSPDGTGKP